MKKTPYKWQTKTFDLFKDLLCFMLNVCCGGGKTFMAIWIALYKKLPVIVIAPKSLCDQWKNDLMDEGVAEEDIWVYDQPTYSKDKVQYEREVAAWLQ